MKRKFLVIIFSLCLVLTSFTMSFAAEELTTSDNVSSFSQTDLAKIENSLEAQGISRDTQDKLIKKLKNGETWDSLSGKAPVSKNTVTNGTETVTTYVYADGSIANCSISGGTSKSGSGYISWTGRKVKYSVTLCTMVFFADYTNTSSYDYISNVYNWNITTVGATYSDPYLRIIKSNENSTGPATARLSCLVTWIGGSGQSPKALTLSVGSNTATASYAEYY